MEHIAHEWQTQDDQHISEKKALTVIVTVQIESMTEKLRGRASKRNQVE